MMSSILFFARHAALAVLFVATAWAAGRVVVRRWATPAPAALTAAVGLAVLAQGLFLLGAIGWLRPLPMLGLAIAAHLVAAPEWLRLAGDWRRLGTELSVAARPGVVAGGSLALLLWVLALYPPVAFDETLYHLPFVRAFSQSGALPRLPDLRFPVFAQLAEILEVPLYRFGDDVDTHAVSWLATLAVAGLLLAWHDREREPAAGRLAAAFWLGSPIVVYLAGIGYVEPLLTLWVTAACYAYARAERGGGPGRARGGCSRGSWRARRRA